MKRLISFLIVIICLNNALIATFSIWNNSGVDRTIYFQCNGGSCPASVDLKGGGFGAGTGVELGSPDKATFWIKSKSTGEPLLISGELIKDKQNNQYQLFIHKPVGGTDYYLSPKLAGGMPISLCLQYNDSGSVNDGMGDGSRTGPTIGSMPDWTGTKCGSHW